MTFEDALVPVLLENLSACFKQVLTSAPPSLQGACCRVAVENAQPALSPRVLGSNTFLHWVGAGPTRTPR